jgi:hypothetical protein
MHFRACRFFLVDPGRFGPMNDFDHVERLLVDRESMWESVNQYVYAPVRTPFRIPLYAP